jgi:hypothetical protein
VIKINEIYGNCIEIYEDTDKGHTKDGRMKVPSPSPSLG